MLNFTEKEVQLFEIIKTLAMTSSPIVTPRLAGGFVRDKIMGIQSNDIDITLDNISGYNFALGLSKFASNNSNVHKILANPEKSKHLETAVLNISGFSIDFVHLRSESYTDSRIPNIKVGTPEEDAYRRDITINSIFYNLITDQIEDFTGKGVSDIHNKLLNTPLDPKVTLFDDPLRILRIFRFKSKFSFSIHAQIYEALKDSRIKNAIRDKVSNERIGIEIFKMLEYQNPHLGLIEIVDCDFIDSIFKPNVEVEVDKRAATRFYENFLSAKKIMQDFKKDLKINQNVILLYIIMQYYLNIKSTKGKKFEYVNVAMAKENLKASKCFFTAIRKIEDNICYLKMLKLFDIEEFIVECGLYCIESLIILYSCTQDYKYIDLIQEIYKNNYEDAHLMKPIINGDFLLEKGIPMPRFKTVLKKSLIIQLKNPNLCRDEVYELAVG